MVEANKEKKSDGQPQDHVTSCADEEISLIMDALEKKYSVGLINERIAALKKFK